MHKTVDPTILYFGAPVALISSLNADGSSNPSRLAESPVHEDRRRRAARGSS